MKTLIRTGRKPQQAFLPIAPFTFESFEVCVQPVNAPRIPFDRDFLQEREYPTAFEAIQNQSQAD